MLKIKIEHDDGTVQNYTYKTLIMSTIDPKNEVTAICLSEPKNSRVRIAGAITAIIGLIKTIEDDIPGLRELKENCIKECLEKET